MTRPTFSNPPYALYGMFQHALFSFFHIDPVTKKNNYVTSCGIITSVPSDVGIPSKLHLPIGLSLHTMYDQTLGEPRQHYCLLETKSCMHLKKEREWSGEGRVL